ncbi:MAG: chemotaxis protein CheW [Gemmatimonadaceae bacterium]
MPQTTEKYLTFFLGEEEYGVDIVRVREIVGVLPITRVPRTAASIRGVINLRGKVIPVVDLRSVLELPVGAAETCIVVTELRGALLGMLIDRVGEVAAIAADEIETPSFGAAVNTQCLRGIAKRGSRVRLLLDLDRAVPADMVPGNEPVAA